MRTYFLLALLLLVGCLRPDYPPLTEDTAHLHDEKLYPFYHGVASGDPLENRVIIWTRVTPNEALPRIPVEWEMATEENFLNITRSGKTSTGPGRDYTVKIDVDGLLASTGYYFRFKALGNTSITGFTQTAGIRDTLRLAVVSCSRYEHGYFNAYRALADEALDAVIHLGDYIYEYASRGDRDTVLGRIPIPDKEIITLQDYRSRYAQYRLDEDLRAAHAAHPFINIWDDHEIANNSYVFGAQNHQENEGSYAERKEVARRVFYEWIPIREQQELYRILSFGTLMDLFMLDERLAGRTVQADSLGDPALLDSARTMLGQQQLKWLTDHLVTSPAQWKIIGNQVIYSRLDWGYPGFRINLDSWDGYPLEQQRIANTIVDNGITNVVFISGDTHCAWAFEATNDPIGNYNRTTGAGAFAVEFGTTSINSSNSDERYPTEEVLAHEQKIVDTDINPHLKFANLRDHGYMVLSVMADRMIAEWKFLESTQTRSTAIKETVKFSVNSGEVKLNRGK